MYKFGNRSKERAKDVNVVLFKCAEEALRRSKYDMTIPWMGGKRTAEEQEEIFKEGNSKCDGYEKVSYHQSGQAIDVIPVDGGYSNTRAMNHFANKMMEVWQEFIIKGISTKTMTWGGTFGRDGWDKPHYEIR
jgi:peptidoglycan L-alanyl-D-glutamate endopeptidase CwlK